MAKYIVKNPSGVVVYSGLSQHAAEGVSHDTGGEITEFEKNRRTGEFEERKTYKANYKQAITNYYKFFRNHMTEEQAKNELLQARHIMLEAMYKIEFLRSEFNIV